VSEVSPCSPLSAPRCSGLAQKIRSALHGISLVFILLVGFAMLKKPPMDQYWWMVKIGIWLFIGLAPALSKKKVLPPFIVLTLTIVAAGAATYLGIYKPF